MFRTRPSSLALTSVGLVAAAILGVQLGQSAIADIDPIHFQGPLERPHAITPPPDPAPFDPYSQPYVWSLPATPGLAYCGDDCGGAQARALSYAMDASAGRDAALPAWRDATPTTELRPWPPGEMPNGGLPIERYMRYPVNREQAERAAAEPAPAPASAPAVAQAPAEVSQPPSGDPEPLVQE
jgi:hypothetical protein